jgi:DNA polymerase elongation subunit (family B)
MIKYFVIKGNVSFRENKHIRWCMAKDDVTPQDIFRLTAQGPSERAIVAKYCIQDCNLVYELLKKIDIITEFVEMAKLCSVPINFLVMRGQGIKLTSFIAKKMPGEKYTDACD